LPEGGLHERSGRAEIYETDNRHRLLCVRRERPCRGYTEKRDEYAPFH
jgi:hypothetical protein